MKKGKRNLTLDIINGMRTTWDIPPYTKKHALKNRYKRQNNKRLEREALLSY